MVTNKTVNQVFTANKALKGQIRVTSENTQVTIQGSSRALRMLAEIIMATVGGGGNTFAQGFKAQLVKSEPSGFMLTQDSVDRITLLCDDQALQVQDSDEVQAGEE
jgi:hypothetical protein